MTIEHALIPAADRAARMPEQLGLDLDAPAHRPTPARSNPPVLIVPAVIRPDRRCEAVAETGLLDGDGEAPLTNDDWIADPLTAYRRWRSGGRANGSEYEPHSLEQYLSMWGRYCEWLAQRQMRVDQVRAEHVQRFLDGLRGGRKAEKPAAPSTRRRYLFLLHRTYAHLAALEVTSGNPCGILAELSPNQASVRPARMLLAPAVEQAFITWCNAQSTRRWEGARDQALRLLFLASGITVAEAQGLRVHDVQLESDGFCALDIQAHGFVPARMAPVASFAVPALANWLRIRSMAGTPGDWVFNTRSLQPSLNPTLALPSDAPLGKSEIYDLVATALRAVGHDRPRAGPQTLRNSYAARQIREGRPLERIAEWMGLNTIEQLREIARQVPRRDDGIAPT